jgi:AraC-like DNA-binding protein
MMNEGYPKIYLYRRLVQAKLYVDAHYADNIDLDNIADEAYFSKFHFIRLFKNIYRRTPHQYLIFVRIEKAMELLKAGGTVSEVCYAVGFESLGSFSGLFKRTVGKRPKRNSTVPKRSLKSIQATGSLSHSLFNIEKYENNI